MSEETTSKTLKANSSVVERENVLTCHNITKACGNGKAIVVAVIGCICTDGSGISIITVPNAAISHIPPTPEMSAAADKVADRMVTLVQVAEDVTVTANRRVENE